ncbi:unnamed protein product [Ranitomeya imitator]|uniref:Uncharacterized protein n=1 Tax=Ranitomeya imitator TaxID=111125 RepID=A0ABN9MJ68_9NEOB|nr:unnamed protein product [Ranitomeya imitator]
MSGNSFKIVGRVCEAVIKAKGSTSSQKCLGLLDNILSPPPMQLRKCSTPEISFRQGKSGKYKKSLNDDGRLLRRGSLGGALTGRYLLPAGAAQQSWQASTETSNLVRMRSQALGQSAPSLTASLIYYYDCNGKISGDVGTFSLAKYNIIDNNLFLPVSRCMELMAVST